MFFFRRGNVLTNLIQEFIMQQLKKYDSSSIANNIYKYHFSKLSNRPVTKELQDTVYKYELKLYRDFRGKQVNIEDKEFNGRFILFSASYTDNDYFMETFRKLKLYDNKLNKIVYESNLSSEDINISVDKKNIIIEYETVGAQAYTNIIVYKYNEQEVNLFKEISYPTFNGPSDDTFTYFLTPYSSAIFPKVIFNSDYSLDIQSMKKNIKEYDFEAKVIQLKKDSNYVDNSTTFPVELLREVLNLIYSGNLNYAIKLVDTYNIGYDYEAIKHHLKILNDVLSHFKDSPHFSDIQKLNNDNNFRLTEKISFDK